MKSVKSVDPPITQITPIRLVSFRLLTPGFCILMMTPHILLTIDVEDWFQVENFKACIPFSSWPSCELRVERNTHRLLDLLDSVKVVDPINPRNPINSSNPKATFFVLGWIAERLPGLVREIHARGHEVASHGCHHELCCDQSPEELRTDLTKSKRLLEDIMGAPVSGYRAPSFSINDEILRIIGEAGYTYDSSYNSFAMHGRYGKIALNGHGGRGISYKIFDGFYELPVSNLPLLSFPALGTLAHFRRFPPFHLPWGGGAYFRLLPFFLFKQGVKRILAEKGAYVFYMHPWEIDADQPDVSEADRFSRFRHYVNLGKTFSRLEKIIHGFDACGFITCSQYLNQKESY